jgi:hypothetical protein
MKLGKMLSVGEVVEHTPAEEPSVVPPVPAAPTAVEARVEQPAPVRVTAQADR